MGGVTVCDKQRAEQPAKLEVPESGEPFVSALARLKTQYEAWREQYVDLRGIVDCEPPPEEAQYAHALEQLVIRNPKIIAAVDDLLRAVADIRGKYMDMFWVAVRGNLAPAGITIGELAVTGRQLMVFWPVTAAAVRPPGGNSKRKIKAKIWCSPYGDEIAISTTAPKNEGDAVGRIMRSHVGNEGAWLAATELPVEFSNQSLSRLVADPQELKRLAAAVAEAICEFVERVRALAWRNQRVQPKIIAPPGQ